MFLKTESIVGSLFVKAGKYFFKKNMSIFQ